MLPIIRPDVHFGDVAEMLQDIFESGILTGGRHVKEFEQMVADYVGTKYAFSTTSATTALHLSLAATGIGRGDEVLVSDFTFPATGNVIVQTGATPVLVDCLPSTFEMDVADAAERVTPKTRAIIPVDPFGQPANMAAVTEFAKQHELVVIEDAATALGASRNGIRCGAWPGAACFSFHPRKVLTTGEGGMITTNDDALAQRIQVLRSHGGAPARIGHTFVENGFNYRLTEIQAALGITQITRIDQIIGDRRTTAQLYMERFVDRGIDVPLSGSPEDCTFQSFVVLLEPEADRNQIIFGLREKGIESTLGTYAMHAQPAFSKFGYRPGDLPNSWRAQQSSLTLPLLPRMEEATVDRVVDALTAALAETATVVVE